MTRVKTWIPNLIYLTLYLVMVPVILYRRVVGGRSLGSFRQRFLGTAVRVPQDRHCIWLHAVSVGEVNLLAPLMEELQVHCPDSRLVISTTTATGMKLAREKYPDRECFYFPIDFSWAIRNALKRVAPDMIVLTELEVWPNLIGIAKQKNVPVVVVNGRLSEKSFRGFQDWIWWPRKPPYTRTALSSSVARPSGSS